MLLPPYSYQNDSLGDCLLDLSARFVINCPKEDLQTAERLFFQIEEAHWFYEDFVRVDNPTLPSMKLRTFVDRLFKACPFLHEYQADPLEALSSFQSYKSLIPVRGGIILNAEMNKVLMVKGWRSNSTWGFPKGKINKDEPDSQCAIREVYEECGFDMTPYLVEQDYLEVTRQGKNIRLYVIRGVPEDTPFETQTRKEISKISWHNLNKMPLFSRRTHTNTANYYLAAPFMPGLKKYINKCKGLATSLTSTETQALENVLGSQGFENDEHAAKNLLSLLKPGVQQDQQHNSHQTEHQPPSQEAHAQSDTAILLNLIKSDHKATDLESAQQVLGLYAQQSDVPPVEPTKIVLPQHYQQTTELSPAISTPPLPPSSMLKDLVSARHNKHKGAGLLSILSRESPQKPASFTAPMTHKSNDLLDLLQPKQQQQQQQPSSVPAPVSGNLSASRRGEADDLMSLLVKETSESSSEAQQNGREVSQGMPANSLMDLLNPGRPESELASEPKPQPVSEPVAQAQHEGAAQAPEPAAASADMLLNLLHGNNKAGKEPAQATQAAEYTHNTQEPAEPDQPSLTGNPQHDLPPVTQSLPQQDDAEIGLLNLLQKSPNKDPYPAHDFLLEYLAKAIS